MTQAAEIARVPAGERWIVGLAVLAACGAAISPRAFGVTAGDLALAVAVLIAYPRLRAAPLPRAVWLAAALWVGAHAVSTGLAVVAGLPERPVAGLMLAGRALEVVVALALGAVAGAAGGRDAVRGGFLLAAGAAGLYGAFEYLLPAVALAGLGGERMARSFERGLFQDEASHFAGLFAIAVAIGLPLVAGGRQPGQDDVDVNPPLRRAARFAVLGGILGALTSGSRLGLVALVVGAGVAAVVSGPVPRRLAIGLAVLAIVAMPAGLERRMATLGAALTGASPSTSALGYRAHNWHIALASFQRHPVLGIGPGTRAQAYYDSELLLALDGGGVIGGMALAAWMATLWITIRDRRRPGETGALVALMLLAVASTSLHITRTALPFAIVAGAALGAAARDPSRLATTAEPRR